MLHIEHRQMYRSNGLIDDFVVHGAPTDYVHFAEQVQLALGSGRPIILKTASPIRIDILEVPEQRALFTSLQNEDDFYASADAWAKRDILRVRGSAEVLARLHGFLVDLSGRGQGYSYLSEFSAELPYDAHSPEWRLHVQ